MGGQRLPQRVSSEVCLLFLGPGLPVTSSLPISPKAISHNVMEETNKSPGGLGCFERASPAPHIIANSRQAGSSLQQMPNECNGIRDGPFVPINLDSLFTLLAACERLNVSSPVSNSPANGNVGSESSTFGFGNWFNPL